MKEAKDSVTYKSAFF